MKMKQTFEMKGNRGMRAKCKKDEKWTGDFFSDELLLLLLLIFLCLDFLPEEE
jgi:hypothetical protein